MALVAYFDYVQLFAINSLQSSILRLVFNSFLGLIILFFYFFPYLTQVICAAHAAPLTCALVCSSPLRQPRIALKSKCRTRLYTGEKWDNPNTHFIFFFCNAPIYTKELTDMKE